MQINPHANKPANSEPQPIQAAAAPESHRRGLRARIDRGIRFLKGKETLLWWFHSGYALLLGLGVMWLGARDFTYVRLIIFYISFIWLSSLLLPFVVNLARLTPKWRERARMTINYFNKNFYQQLLFFLLPIYYASTTLGSRNMAFLVLLAVSAVLSTMDVVYDRYVSVRWQLTALFFMFNLFASINVMLPVLWTVSNHWALWISGVLAFGGFASMVYRLSGLRGARVKWLLGAAACALLLIVVFLPPFIPPAPLTLARAEFGRSVRALTHCHAARCNPFEPRQDRGADGNQGADGVEGNRASSLDVGWKGHLCFQLFLRDWWPERGLSSLEPDHVEGRNRGARLDGGRGDTERPVDWPRQTQQLSFAAETSWEEAQ